MKIFIRFFSAIIIAICVGGCVTFDLGTVYPSNGQTVAQRDSDMAVCKEKAREAANTPERVAGGFVAGMTIVGAPLAIEAEKKLQREVFAACMSERGYVVDPPKVENKNVQDKNQKINDSNQKSDITINLQKGWEDQKITEQLQKSGVVRYSTNKILDAGLIISVLRTKFINDPNMLPELSMRNLETILKNVDKSEILYSELNGYPVAQYEISGTQNVNGQVAQIKYFSTLIAGEDQIVMIRFNSTTLNYDFYKPMFLEMLGTITGGRSGNYFKPPQKTEGAAKNNLTKLREKCSSLGFRDATEEHSSCMMEILKNSK